MLVVVHIRALEVADLIGVYIWAFLATHQMWSGGEEVLCEKWLWLVPGGW